MLVTVGLCGSLGPEHARDLDAHTLMMRLRMINFLIERVQTNGVFIAGRGRVTVDALRQDLEKIGIENATVRQLAGKIRRSVEASKDRFLADRSRVNESPTSDNCQCPLHRCTFVVDISLLLTSGASVQTCQTCSQKIVPLEQIFFSNDTEALRTSRQLFIDPKWTKERFISEVWRPLFELTSKAEIYDRQIYRIIKSSMNVKSSDTEHEDDPSQYIRGIQWICHVFGESAARYTSFSGREASRILVFNCEIHRSALKEAMRFLGWRTPADPDDAALRRAGTEILRRECDIDNIEKATNIQVRFGLNLFGWSSRTSSRMRHNRYIKTPYSYVAIDRGVPALQGDAHSFMTEVLPLGKEIEQVNPGSCDFSFV